MEPEKPQEPAPNLDAIKAPDQGKKTPGMTTVESPVLEENPLVGILTADEIHQLEHFGLNLEEVIRAIESSEE
jgi:hypothetical protein